MVLESFVIDRKSYAPVSTQIASFLKKKIVDEELKPGQRLPTTTEIMKRIKVGTKTVREAMADLEKAGLIESTPGRGTFVKKLDAEYVSSVDRTFKTNLKRICLVGTFDDSSQGGWYRRLMVGGVLKQCHAFGCRDISLFEGFADFSNDEIYDRIVSSECDGVVWLLPEPRHWEIIEKLTAAKVPLVVARKCHGNDGVASVEVDYEMVGFEAGCFLIKGGCEGVVLFTQLQAGFGSEAEIKHGLWPNTISFGFHRAFRSLFPDNHNNAVVELPLGGCYQTAIKKFEEAIKKYGTEYGMFFVDPMYLATFLVHGGEKAGEVVKGRKIMMINNWDNYSIFAPYSQILDIHSFMDQPEEVGLLAVQKLSGLIEGHLANTVTSLQLSLEDSSMKSIKKLVGEIDSRELKK